MRIGFTEEAEHFMKYLHKLMTDLPESSLENSRGPLQIMYGIRGERQLKEEILDNLEGYMKSSPVRIGNDAAHQLQLDIYGELMDTVYLYNKYGAPIGFDAWRGLVKMLDWLADNWQQKDEGIWEARSGRQHYTYSKVMCWVAFDRALRLAEKRSFPAPREKWLKIRDEIYMAVQEHGWSKERKSFVQFFGSTTLDASNLIMPLVLFMSPNDPKMAATIQSIMNPCGGKRALFRNGLVFRYDVSEFNDGLTGEEGAFNICTFWLIESLTRAGKHEPGSLQDARLLFEDMMSYANHLGLFAYVSLSLCVCVCVCVRMCV